MDELALAKKQRTKKNQGGAAPLPLRRRFVREKLEAKDRYGGRMGNTSTPEEIEELKATLAMPKSERLARMERFIEECDQTIALVGGESTMLLSQIEDRAEELMRERGIDHGEGMRLALSDAHVTGRKQESGRMGSQVRTTSDITSSPSASLRDDEDEELERRLGEVYGNDEEMREAVERRMEIDKKNYRD